MPAATTQISWSNLNPTPKWRSISRRANWKSFAHWSFILKKWGIGLRSWGFNRASMKLAGILQRIAFVVLAIVTTSGLFVTFAGYIATLRYFEITGDYRPYQLGLGIVCTFSALLFWRS